MKLTIPNSGNWLAAAASWRREGRDRLELWLPHDWPRDDAELRWRRVVSTGAVRQGSQRGLEGLAPAEEIIVWTPAAETLLLRANLPTRSAAKIVQALPYALEEQLIEPPERLHFAYTHEADGSLAVAVTSRERMDRWVSAVAAARRSCLDARVRGRGDRAALRPSRGIRRPDRAASARLAARGARPGARRAGRARAHPARRRPG